MIGVFREPAFRFRIERKYKRDAYNYEIEFLTHGVRECNVRQFCTDNIRNGFISDDNKYIKLDKPFFISGINGEATKGINKLKVPKAYLSQIKEWINP